MKHSLLRLLRLPSMVLAAALQILPLVRAALPATQNAANVIVMILRWATGTAAAFGGVNAVSGASTTITNPLNVTGTNGTAFSLRLTTAPDQAHYWTAPGLPAGLTLTGTSGATLWRIQGTPTQTGNFSISVTAKDQASSGASRTVTATLSLNIAGASPTPPSITAQPTNKTVMAGQSASFIVTAAGTAPLACQWRKAGSGLGNQTNATLTLAATTFGDAGNYDVVVTNHYGSVTSSVATLTVTASGDTRKPTLAVKIPSAPVSVSTTSQVTMAGTAGDNVGLAFVKVFPEAGGTILATGTMNWTALVDLNPGTNRFQIAAFDADGNAVTNTRILIFTVLSPLRLSSNGTGAILGATNGQRLEVGRSQTLTAKAGAGFVFSNWTGTITSTANPLVFLMQSNMTLAANFVVNPYVSAVGDYNGLYYDSNDVRSASAGSIRITVRPDGQFTGLLVNGSRRHSVAGRFDLDGRATNQIVRRGTNSLTVGLLLDLHGAGTITGTITDGSWASAVLAYRAVFNTRTNPATGLAHLYTLLLPGATVDAVAPAGDGFGSARVDLAGNNTFAGELADASRVAFRVPVSGAGDWPFYASLYKGAGAVIGWLSVQPAGNPAIGGTVHWIRPSGPAPKFYTNGFLLDAAVAGSIYTPPGTNRLLNASSGEIAFEGGNRVVALTNTVSFGPSGRVTNGGPATLTFSARTSTGLFTGTVLLPGVTRAVPFKGAVLQSQVLGGGYFLGTNRIGNVSLSAGNGGGK